jgi:hypothetical protein
MADPEHERRIEDEKLAAILDAINAHTVEYHSIVSPDRIGELVKEHEYMLVGMREGRRDISRILEVVEGVPDVNAHGETIGYIGGMRNDIAELRHMSNGGGGFSITAKDKAQLVAWITIVGTAIGAIISQLH